jgi:phenylalanyl-tRNA synthetase beta chain
VLSRIADDTQSTDDECIVNPPSYRFDVERECDLVEEVARVYGYANIPTVMPTIKPSSVVATESSISIRKAKDRMASLGYQEVINYSFIDPAIHELVSDIAPVKLTNPLADNMSVMRTNLLAGLLQTMQYNLNRQQSRVRIFEAGAVYLETPSGFSEKQYIAGLVCGSKYVDQWAIKGKDVVDFYDIKSDVESLLSLTDLQEPIIFNTLQHKALHPGQQAAICRGDKTIGWLGKIHPSIAKSQGFKSDVFVFELAQDGLLESTVPSFKPVSKFPSVTRDISVVIDAKTPVASVEQAVLAELNDSLSSIVLFDIYQGDAVGEDKKSLSYSLSFRRDDRTYTDDEVEVFIQRALGALEEKVGGTLRS